MNETTRAAASVSEMARMVHLSRARFYQLVGEGVFPPPVYSVSTKRPLYVEELQSVCLEVRNRNCGINGRPVLFYSMHRPISGLPKPRQKALTPKKKDEHAAVTTTVRGLGLTTATADQVAQAIKSLYPNGVNVPSDAEVIRAVFLHLQRQNRAGNVG